MGCSSSGVKVVDASAQKPLSKAGGEYKPLKAGGGDGTKNAGGPRDAKLQGAGGSPPQPQTSEPPANSSGADEFILECRVVLARNLPGLGTGDNACEDERAEAERDICNVLDELERDLGGEYYPLQGSNACPFRPGGMSDEEAALLKRDQLMFASPAADHRGVFAATSGLFAAWVNGPTHHLTLIAREPGLGVQAALSRSEQIEAQVRSSLAQEVGQELTPRMGSGLCVEANAALPLLSRKSGFHEMLSRMNLSVLLVAGLSRITAVLDDSEDAQAQVAKVEGSLRVMVGYEKRLAAGEKFSLN